MDNCWLTKLAVKTDALSEEEVKEEIETLKTSLEEGESVDSIIQRLGNLFPKIDTKHYKDIINHLITKYNFSKKDSRFKDELLWKLDYATKTASVEDGLNVSEDDTVRVVRGFFAKEDRLDPSATFLNKGTEGKVINIDTHVCLDVKGAQYFVNFFDQRKLEVK